MRSLFTVLIILWLASTAFADFSGPVVGVLDGDTIEVLNGHHTERIRLSGIDCPEKGQAYGRRPSKPPQPWSLGRKSRFKPTAKTSTGALLPMCSY